MESNTIHWLEELVPDRAPLRELTTWEYGFLAGQRELIEKIKDKLKVKEEIKDV